MNSFLFWQIYYTLIRLKRQMKNIACFYDGMAIE